MAERPSAPRGSATRPLTVLVSGASGLIGSALVPLLRADGHTVLRLVRRRPHAEDEVNWAPSAHTIDQRVMDRVDAVINLSGASLARIPWTKGYKRQIRESRISATKTLSEAMNTASNPPSVYLSASAVGYYGDRPGQRLTEDSPKGEGFLADVVEQWERAASFAPERTRVVQLRTGIVIGKGGVLKPLIPLTWLGAGARFGSGGQHWPWISLHDEAAAIRHLLTSQLAGPVNLAGPVPATSDRITSHLAKRMRRWYNLAIPEWAIATGAGTAGREMLLSSLRVVPKRLLDDGFAFTHERVEQAIDAQLEK